MDKKRVVVTGIGAVSPIGNNIKENWESIKNSVCGINYITKFDTTDYRTKVDAEVKNLNFEDHFDHKFIKHSDASTLFAIIAAREAFKDSELTKDNIDMNKVGSYISTGIGGVQVLQEQSVVCKEKGNRRVSPMLIPMSVVNMASGNVSIDLGLKGESICISTACASSTNAIGEAYRAIMLGDEDAIVVGGTENGIVESTLAGFENMKALTSSDDINRASIPFDKERSGFVMGEGAAVLVLEELEHAIKRKAHIYAEVVGYGAASDAFHITSPESNGDGIIRAMERALETAKINKEQIEYINAHGTSTHLNDVTETIAIKTLFKDHYKDVLVSSTKGNTGHMLGAAGAIEAIYTIKALDEGIIPPTINYKTFDEECDLNIVVNKPINKNIKYAMSNSLGFGGHNASIIFKKWDE